MDDFQEVPADTTCALGESFIIRCRVPPNAVSAHWVFNNTNLSITQLPWGVSVASHGTLFYLNITCIPERHYITIQCIGVIWTGESRPMEILSPPALIKVQGVSSPITMK